MYPHLFFLELDTAAEKEFNTLLQTEAVVQRCSVKKVFLEISQNPQENTCAKVSFLIKLQSLGQVLSCEFCEISKNTFFYRTPLVATSTQMTLELVVILMFKQSPKMNSKSK